MNAVLDALRQLAPIAGLHTASRQLRLRLGCAGEACTDALLPQRLSGRESICGGIEYRIDCLAGSPRLALKNLVALPAEIGIVTDGGKLRSVCGLVTEARAGDFDGGLAVYHLVVRDALAIMEKRINSRIFRGLNELQIVKVLFDEWRSTNAVLAGAFEYELDPHLDMGKFPVREQTMQCNESDAAFVRRLLKRRGIAWHVRPGRSRHAPADRAGDGTPAHTLVLFADPGALPRSDAGTVRYHRDDATDRRDVVTSWTAARTLGSGSSTRHSWDYKNPLGAQFMTASARGNADQGPNGNQLAATLDDYLVEIPHAGSDPDDHLLLGQVRMQRHDYETKCFHGEGNVRGFCAGVWFELADHPEIDSHAPAEREFVITEIALRARNNLPGDLAARAERLLAPSRAPSTTQAAPTQPVQLAFTAVRRGVPIVPHYDPHTDLPQPQLQSAIVVGPPGEEVHCDALGRVKIRFPGMRGADHRHAHGAGASGSPADSAWVRVMSNWAGNGPGAQQQCGTLGLPRVGSEVLVAFLGGDPDRPVVIGQVFNQLGEPPALSPRGGLPGNRYLSGLKSREIGGRRGNRLRLDDTRGQISAQLSSDHATSQLNLGWLTHPRANGGGEARGEGAELRSDEAVAIRGGKGVLVTAEPAAEAVGAQLARAELTGLADMLEGVVSEVARLAQHHTGDDDAPRLAELVDKLRHWDAGSNVKGGSGGGAPIVAVAAPAGIVLGSSANVAIGAQNKVDVASAGDAAISAGSNVFVRAARGISAFAHALGIKLVSASGNVTLQTHQGNVEIKSAGRISLVAAEGIDLQAPAVRIVGQGAQTDWDNERIVQQSTGKHIVKAAAFVRSGPGGGTPADPDFVSTSLHTDERVVLSHTQTGRPLPNIRYAVELDDGSTIEGKTDQEGRSALLGSDLIRVAKVVFFKDDQP